MGIQMTWARALPRRHLGPVRDSQPQQAVADSADDVLTSLYHDHYRHLVRLAALLVHDITMAEDFTQAAFAMMHTRYRRLKDHGARMAYLRQVVVREARAARRPLPTPIGEDQPEVFALLRSLPDRQREALVLRYYADLSEAEAAAAMGVTRGALRRHAARGLTAVGGNALICDGPPLSSDEAAAQHAD